MRNALTTLGLFLFFARALFPQNTAPSKPASAWNDYQVILWSTGDPICAATWLDRVREAGFTAEQCSRISSSGRFVPAHLGLLVENLVSELAFHPPRNSLYDNDRKTYTGSGDQRFLLRKPSFDDPAFWDAIMPRLLPDVRRHAGNSPLLYDSSPRSGRSPPRWITASARTRCAPFESG